MILPFLVKSSAFNPPDIIIRNRDEITSPFLRNEDELTSSIMHHSFRPSLPDLKVEKY